MLALSVLRTQAQSLSIKGRVTDASQEAVIAANVSLWTIDSTLVTGVTSDAQGKFALPKIKAGDYRLSISFIGLQSENILLKLNKSLDLGDVQLQEDAVSLGEVTVSASNVLQRVDRQIILPSESQLKRSFGAYDLLNNLGIARLQVDNLSNSMSVSGGGAVQTRINGIKVTDKEIAAVRAKDVLRVEFIEDPGKQYGDDELGAVVNIILRRRETGGVVNFQLSDSPHTLWGENFLSAKFNYKNSEWGIDYFNKNGKYHSRLESHETFYLGDRTIDRIKEGIEDESPSLSFINNLNLTYNLTKADKYVFNAIFRNNLSNAPYQNELNKMWAVGSTESIYSYVNNHTSSYSPALDLSFQYTPQGDMFLNGRYTLTGGTIKYSIPVIPLKEFNVQEGSYVQWTGNPMDPTLNLTATERVRTSVTLTGQSSPRLVNFDVGIELTQQLENLGLQFTLTAPEDMAMQEELTSKGPEERAKLAVSMLVTGMYLGGGGGGGGGASALMVKTTV